MHSHSFSLSTLKTLYPLSLINGGLEDSKAVRSASSAAIGRNLTAHQGYAVVAGMRPKAGWGQQSLEQLLLSIQSAMSLTVDNMDKLYISINFFK